MAMHDLRKSGCTCHPILTPQPRSAWPSPAAVYGFEIRHFGGCKLGDQFVALNAIGIVPQTFFTSSRCER